MKTNAQQIATMADAREQAAAKAKADALALAKNANTFHTEVFAAARKVTDALGKVKTVKDSMSDVIKARYGDVGPSFEEYRADHAMLKALAVAKGLKDHQWVRKPYNAALKSLYKELPVSDSPDAVAKRAQRASDALVDAEGDNAGAPKGETSERRPSPSEQLEQWITAHGVWDVLEACARIMECDDATKLTAKNLRNAAKAGQRKVA